PGAWLRLSHLDRGRDVQLSAWQERGGSEPGAGADREGPAGGAAEEPGVRRGPPGARRGVSGRAEPAADRDRAAVERARDSAARCGAEAIRGGDVDELPGDPGATGPGCRPEQPV